MRNNMTVQAMRDREGDTEGQREAVKTIQKN